MFSKVSNTGMKSPVPATTGQIPGSAPSMGTGHFAKALEHHGHAGAALKAGDGKKAMHHLGHMLSAITKAGKTTPPGQMTGAKAPPMAAAPNGALPPDDGSDGMPTASIPSNPAKPSFNRSIFAKMKGK